jgi:hypothetical protein
MVEKKTNIVIPVNDSYLQVPSGYHFLGTIHIKNNRYGKRTQLLKQQQK